MFAALTGPLPRRFADEASREAHVADLLALQAAAGLDLLSDGAAWTEDLAGTVADRLAVPSPGRADRLADRHADGVRRRGPLVLDEWQAAARLTDRPVKAVLPGPLTLADRWGALVSAVGPAGPVAGSASDSSFDLRSLAVALAEPLGEEVAALAAAGCPFVEIQEPAAVSIGADAAARAAFVVAHRRLLRDAGALHVSLAITGGSADAAGPETIFAPPYASYLFDLRAGPDNWRLAAAAPDDRGIIVGACLADPAADDDLPLAVWGLHYAASTGGRGPSRVGVANAGPLDALDRPGLERVLGRLGEVVRVAGRASVDEIAAGLDPRAIDSRTAALGRVVPRRRPRVRPGR